MSADVPGTGTPVPTLKKGYSSPPMMVRKQLSCEPDAQRSATIKATPHYVVVCVRGDERGVYLWDYFWTNLPCPPCRGVV